MMSGRLVLGTLSHGFLYSLLHDKSPYECGQLGNFVASRSVMAMGARAGLPYAKDLALLG
jgi:sugar/nucleoside kinase (ribokinase family)